MFWVSIPSRFAPCFSIKVKKHCPVCLYFLNNTWGEGGNMCPTLQKNNQNKTQKLPRFQNPLIPVRITWKKNRPLSPPPKKTPTNQKETGKHESAEGTKTYLTQFHQFISTTNILITCHADIKLNISDSEEGQYITP